MNPQAKWPRWGVIACVALPVLGLLFGIVRPELQLARSEEWVLSVRGYDPRDLLRGRYIEYRLDLKEAPSSHSCPDEDPECCLCLTRVSAQAPPQVRRESCAMARACDGLLRTDSLSSLQRFYVPEAHAAEAERRLRDAADRDGARLVIAVDPSGAPQVKNLTIDGVPLVR